jgi:hypothetical protein
MAKAKKTATGKRKRAETPREKARGKKAEEAFQLQVLNDNAKINRGGPLKAGETHTVEGTASGPPRVVRKRFSAT